MAVYTEVGEATLRAFLARYPCGRLHGWKGIAEGVENTNYLLRTEGGRFILTLYEGRTSLADIPFFLSLMNHLAGRGLPCPRPLAACDGSLMQSLCGKPAALTVFLEGRSPLHVTARHCEAIGGVMARLHEAASDFRGEVRENDLSVAGWRALLTGLADRAGCFADGLAATLEDDWQEVAGGWPSALPEGIVHADVFPDNTLFVDGRLSGLLDFYFSCRDFLAYDLAVAMNAWCFSEDGCWRRDYAAAMASGYGRLRPLRREEAEALPVLARGAALRFFLTRLHDWFAPEREGGRLRKDPAEYLGKLAFHRRRPPLCAFGVVS